MMCESTDLSQTRTHIIEYMCTVKQSFHLKFFQTKNETF